MTDNSANSGKPAILQSWKEIAAYLQRDVSTVTRWERYEGLPVRRHEHQKRSSVYAIPEELDAWRAARQPESEAPPKRWFLRPLIAAAVAVVLLGSGWALWRSGALRLPYPLVEAAEPGSRRLWAGDTPDSFGSGASTNGRLVVFTDWGTGNLTVMELATGQRRNLTRDANVSIGTFAQFPAESPDGQLVAYSWLVSNAGYELRTIATAEGSEPRTLYSNPECPVIAAADWSRDGKQLLVRCFRRDGTQSVAMLAVDSGELRVVKSFAGERSPQDTSLSPDGRYIAYDLPQAEVGLARDILLLASDGSRESLLVRHSGHDSGPMWTPGGDRLVFFSDRSGALGLWTVAVEDGRTQGEPALVWADAGQLGPLGFSPDGALYYSLPRGTSELLVAEMDLETGGLLSEPVSVVSRYGRPHQRPDWSRDGRNLAYQVVTSSLAKGGTLRVVVRDFETGQEREMSQGFRNLGTAPKWRPDGKTLLLYGILADGGLARSVQLDATDGSALPGSRSWEPECLYPQWSTASDVVWCLDREGQDRGIVRRRLDTGEETGRLRFTSPSANVLMSPDGRSVAFVGPNRTLHLAAVEGGEQREIFRVESGPLKLLSWTPDSQYVLCLNDESLWRIPASGGQARMLPIPVKGMQDLRVNPDGKRVAMWVPSPGSEIWVLENFLPGTAVAR